MSKSRHEVRDPIHTFIRVTDDERKVIDSAPVQRLRHIHQLGTTYLLYPGATHRRFEHSLGVMELARRVYDIVTDPANFEHAPKEIQRRIHDSDAQRNWGRVLRMAALCHDVGHLPFSHAAEEQLLPEGWNHERLTVELIRGRQMGQLWQRDLEAPLKGEDIVKLAVGPKRSAEPLDVWQTMLAEIIVGDAFGVDRMDYLLRDSLHIGVAYGRFDHFRLIDTLRILRPVGEVADPEQPVLGVEEGGLHSAEALLMARYFMYTQVYFHRVRRIYDIHLRDFLIDWLPGGRFPTDPERHLRITDAEVTAGLLKAARDPRAKGHEPAKRIVERSPFKLLWEWADEDVRLNPDAGNLIHQAAVQRFGEEAVRRDHYAQSSPFIDFPVLLRDGRIESARLRSDVIRNLPVVRIDFVFIRPDLEKEAIRWLDQNRQDILRHVPEE